MGPPDTVDRLRDAKRNYNSKRIRVQGGIGVALRRLARRERAYPAPVPGSVLALGAIPTIIQPGGLAVPQHAFDLR